MKAETKARFAVAILAAGQGTRFRSQKAKVLHSAGGRTLIEHCLRTAASLSPIKTFVIVGHQADAVVASLKDFPHRNLRFIHQKQQRGTGHALLEGARLLRKAAPTLLVVVGDAPMLTRETLEALLSTHRKSGAAATVLTADMDVPSGYGRIIRAAGDSVSAIVEHKSASPMQRAIREINTGIYCFQTKELFAALRRVKPDPITKEYYLTDAIGILADQSLRVAASKAASSNEVIGINDRAELARVDSLFRARKARELMLAGVTILAPETVRIDPEVAVGTDTEIEPGVILLGRTRIGKNCRVGAYSIITDSQVADGALVLPHSVITESSVATGARVGPFTHLRPQSEIGPGAQVGAYVEVKKSRVGRDVKAHHLAYIGDAKLGRNVNFSAGAITANYDGAHKSETIVEDNAFIGSASELIAPVHVGRNAYVAGGSTITDDVPANALAIARGRQVNKPGWVTRRKKKSASR